MEDVIRSFWWLVFPIGGFVYAAWDSWLSYRRSKDQLELMKSYAAQGREPPPELLRRVERDTPEELDEEDGAGGRRWRRRDYRRWRRRYGYRDDFRSTIFSGFLAGAFWIAAEMQFLPNTSGAFRLVALILAFVSAATLLSGILSRGFRDR
jgi:hypothetical protein